MRRDLRLDDQGFTLVELIIAMSLSLVILTISYFIFDAGLAASTQVEGNTAAVRNAQRGLHIMGRFLREAEYLDRAADNALMYRADHDDDGAFEEVYYYYDTVNHRLMQRVRELNTTTYKTYVLAENVRNESSEPIFTYRNRTGAVCVPDTDGEDGERLTQSWKITLTLKIDTDLAEKPDPYRVKTDIHLRNQL